MYQFGDILVISRDGIASDIRDKHVNQVLTDQGYKVLRFWEHEINSDVEGCFKTIKNFK